MKKVVLLLVSLFLVVSVFATAKFNNTEQTKYANSAISHSSRATVLSEDFSSGALPTGWQNVDNASGGVWQFDNPGGRSINTPTASNGFAIFDSDHYGYDSQAEDSDLITPAIDCSALTNVTFDFYHYFKSGYGGAAEVFVSGDNGATWTSLESWSSTSTANAAYATYDVTAIAAGQSQVKFKWHWTGDYSWYWAVDDVKVYEKLPYDVAITRITPNQSIAQGGFYYYYQEIRNNGSNNDTYDLSLVNASASTWYTIIDKQSHAVIDSIAINAGEVDSIIVKVDVPSTASDGTVDSVKVKATSQGDPSVSATINDAIITTAKGISNLPFTDHFDARNFTDWMNTSNAYTTVDWNASAAQSGAGGVRFADVPSDGYYGSAMIWKYMQGFNAASMTHPVLDFWYKFSGSDYRSGFYAQFITMNGEIDGIQVSESYSNTTWTHVQIDITNLSNYADLQAGTWALRFAVQPYADLYCDLDEVQIYDLAPPSASTNPSPADGATNVATDATLSWTLNSTLTDSSVVWFGENTRAMTAVDTLAGDASTYNPGTLTLGATYQWKIVTYNPSGDNSATAPTWTFTVVSDPLFSLNPDETTHDFGQVLVGGETAWQTYIVSNSGGDGLVINDIVLSDTTDFTLSKHNTFPDTLNNGDTLSVKVKFSPATIGNKSANLIFKKNALSNYRSVALSGEALDTTGDTADNPFIVSFTNGTFTDSGNTSIYNSDYPFTTSEDVIYKMELTQGQLIDISYEGSDFDTKMFVFNSLAQLNAATSTTGSDAWYYNDDEGNAGTGGSKGGKGNRALWSKMLQTDTPAATYYIVVTGYSTNSGNYVITIHSADYPAPSYATNPSPADGATGIATSPTLTWTNADYTETIDLWFGDTTKKAMTKVLDNVAAVETYSPTGLSSATTYQWKVVCRNYTGETPTDSVRTWTFTTIASPPDPVTYVSPDSAATDVPTNVTLQWNTTASADGYYLYLGTASGNYTIANGTDLGNVSTYNFTANYSTTYYWKIVPYNAVGSATGAREWNFTTMADPTIHTFPYTQDFENGGVIPQNWTNDTTDAGGDWEFQTTDSHGPTADHTSGTGYYALLNDYSIYSSNSPFNLLTPPLDFSTAGKTYQISYWAWIGPDGADNPIHVDVSNDGGSSWTTDVFVHDHSITETWFKNTISLSAYSANNVIVRFRAVSTYGVGTDNSGIDDVTIEEIPPSVPTNMAITISGNDVNLTWDVATGANSYLIYRATDPYGTYTQIATTGTNAYTDVNAAGNGVKYFYYVKASNAAPTLIVSPNKPKVVIEHYRK